MWGLPGWAVVSSLAVFPHSVSYFNEPAGGPENAAAHLIDASVDWGQGMRLRDTSLDGGINGDNEF